MNKADLLKTEHQVQMNWLQGQIGNIANDGQKAFLNAETADRAYSKLRKALIVDDADLEHFMSIHLSKVGVQKLVTTLRVYKKRNGSEQLQVEFTSNNRRRLDEIVKKSGKTKIEIINYLILHADVMDFVEFK
jgi:hypothetical protein